MSADITIQAKGCETSVIIDGAFVESIDETVKQLASTPVSSDTIGDCAAMLKACVAIRKKADTDRKAWQRPFLDTSRAVKAEVDKLMAPLIHAEQGFKAKVAAYEKARAAEERRLKKLAEEAERRAAEEAAEADMQDDLADEIEDLFGEGEPDTAPVVIVASVPTAAAPAKPKSMVFTSRLVWDVVDFDACLSAWKKLNAVAVNGHMKEHKDTLMKRIEENDGKPIAHHGLSVHVETSVKSR